MIKKLRFYRVFKNYEFEFGCIYILYDIRWISLLLVLDYLFNKGGNVKLMFSIYIYF